jgi:D-alanyl-D-alanine carboxypeptidase
MVESRARGQKRSEVGFSGGVAGPGRIIARATLSAYGFPVLSRLVAVAGVLATCLLVAGAGTAAAAARLSVADRSFVDAAVAQAMREDRLPGVTIKISGPKGSYEKAYGVADTRIRSPMAIRQHVRIASITKTFVATAILQQVQRRRLSLSDTLDRWVKGIPYGRRITVRDLLDMRAGVYDFTSNGRLLREWSANPRLNFTPSDVVAMIRRHKPQFAPGTRTKYTDSNYVLLGIILEKVTGRSAESVIARDVIRPAGLRHTSFPTTAAMPKPYAHGYYAGDDGNGRIRDYTRVNPKASWTAGAMVSTLGDLARWGKVLALGTLLSRGMQAQRLRFGTIPNASGPPVGYGLGILRFGDWLGHDGAIFGFSTETFYDPKTGAEITSTANLSTLFSTPTLAIFGTIAKHLYPESLGSQRAG